jgi:hypothetical protein
MATWPLVNPPAPLVDGYVESFEDRRIVFTTEYGPAKARPRTSRPVRVFQVAWAPLDVAAVQQLETFYRVTTRAGEIPFDWPHPRTQATIAARFTGPAVRAPLLPGVWRLAATLDAVVTPPAGTGALVWPASLPQQPLLAAYEESYGQYAVHGDLPGGAPVGRRRTTADPGPIRVTFVLTLAQVLTFDGFYEEDTKGGALPFTWTHPDRGAVRLAFTAGPQIRALDVGVFELAGALEVFP